MCNVSAISLLSHFHNHLQRHTHMHIPVWETVARCSWASILPTWILRGKWYGLLCEIPHSMSSFSHPPSQSRWKRCFPSLTDASIQDHLQSNAMWNVCIFSNTIALCSKNYISTPINSKSVANHQLYHFKCQLNMFSPYQHIQQYH